jgi:mRNA interferase HigB
MRIITRKRIDEYSAIHPDAENALNDWYEKTEQSEWTCFADAKTTFNSIDNVGAKRHVFNIKGNAYRLIALILFVPKIVYIRFIGTHAEYSKIKNCSKI